MTATMPLSKEVSNIYNPSSKIPHQPIMQMSKASQLDITMITTTQQSGLTKEMYTATRSEQKR